MCQVMPFTLPCCRRIYVSVEKLPSCPDDWPRKKCPKELIIQISGYEPKDVQHRNRGVCWRCLADRTGWEREALRPVLDRAFVVEGLEEWNMDERRVRVEKAGLCWHCGADRGCAACGSGKGGYSGTKEVLELKGKRGRAVGDVVRRKDKRLRAGQASSSRAAPSSTTSTPFPEQHTLDPALSPDFNYQPQEVQFQAPILQHASGSWQGGHNFQNHGFYNGDSGNIPVDPLLFQQQGGQQVDQSSSLPVRQDLPPLPDFGADVLELDLYKDINDKTMSRLMDEYNEQLLKTEEDDKKTIAQISAAPQIEPSLGSTQYQHPAP